MDSPLVQDREDFLHIHLPFHAGNLQQRVLYVQVNIYTIITILWAAESPKHRSPWQRRGCRNPMRFSALKGLINGPSCLVLPLQGKYFLFIVPRALPWAKI